MRKLLLALALAAIAQPAAAVLPVGAAAPNFTTTGVLDGKAFRLNLREELGRGPVVLYFYPKAFTKGCTLEARAFSEAMPKFRAAGAKVIGVSADDVPTLRRFSVKECNGKFPVAAATPAMIRAYDVAMPVVNRVSPMTNRTSYVIDRRGRIRFVHSDLDWSQHVKKTLAAVRALNR